MSELQEGCYKLKSEHVGARFFPSMLGGLVWGVLGKSIQRSSRAIFWMFRMPDEDPRQVMDVWLPNEGEGPFPLIVFVHGGGWVSGNKRENTMPGVFKFPSQGYAVACSRISPGARCSLA